MVIKLFQCDQKHRETCGVVLLVSFGSSWRIDLNIIYNMIIFIQVLWYCIKHYAGVIDIVWIYWLSIEPFRIEIIDCGCVRCISFNSRSPELTDRQLNINWCPFPYSFLPFNVSGNGQKTPEVVRKSPKMNTFLIQQDPGRFPFQYQMLRRSQWPLEPCYGLKKGFSLFFWLCHDAQVVLGL